MTNKKAKNPKPRTEKSKYKSRYCSNETYIHAAQYIVEVICTNKAYSEKKELPFYFWDLPEWKAFYRSQIHTANSLLKKYRSEAILKVLAEPKQARTFSLRAPWLAPLFEAENKKIILAEEQIEIAKKEAADRNVNIVVGTNIRKEKPSGRLGRLSQLDEE